MYKIEEIVNTIINGDATAVLKNIPDESIDIVITSPPYFNLRNYLVKGQIGLEKTVKEYQDRLLEVFFEVKRVLKNTGQFWLNIGDCYGGIKSGKTDNIVSKDTKESNKKISKNLPKQSKSLMMIPERLTIRLMDEQGWILRNKIKWVKQILDFEEKKTYGSTMPTASTDRFNESAEDLYFFVKNKKYYSNLESVKLPMSQDTLIRVRNFINNNHKERLGDDSFHKIDPSGKAQEGSLVIANMAKKIYGETVTEIDESLITKNLPSMWKVRQECHNFKKEYPELNIDHFASYPSALIEIPIKFGSPVGGIVLDPFSGSFTTCLAAKRLKRNWIGIELSKEYCKLGQKRINDEPQTLL